MEYLRRENDEKKMTGGYHKSYRERISGQREILDTIMNDLHKNPTDWSIDFEKLNDYGKKLILTQLKDFLNDYLDMLPAIDYYKLNFGDHKEKWWYFPLTGEQYKLGKERLTI